MVAIVKLGISCSYQIIYISHTVLFPTLFAATAIGWLQFAACIVTGLAPFVVHVTESPVIPMITLTVLAGIGTGLVLLLINEKVKHKTLNRSMSTQRTLSMGSNSMISYAQHDIA